MVTPTRVIHSIICCRILLNLRQAAVCGGNLTGVSTGLVFAVVPGQQTNRAETIQLEAYGARSAEEDPRRQEDVLCFAMEIIQLEGLNEVSMVGRIRTLLYTRAPK